MPLRRPAPPVAVALADLRFGSGVRTESGASPYSTTGLDRDALHAWVMVRPGKVVAVSNVHLSSGADEAAMRLAEAEPLAALGRLAADGTPVFLTGDFNSSSHLDRSAAERRAGAGGPIRSTAPSPACLPMPGCATATARRTRTLPRIPGTRSPRRAALGGPARARAQSASTMCSRPGAAKRSRRRSSARPAAPSPTSPSSPGLRTIGRGLDVPASCRSTRPPSSRATPRLVAEGERRIGAHLGSVRSGLDGARGPARRRAGGRDDRRARHAARLAAHDPALDDRPRGRRLRCTPRRRGRRGAAARRVHDRGAGREARDRGGHRFDARSASRSACAGATRPANCATGSACIAPAKPTSSQYLGFIYTEAAFSGEASFVPDAPTPDRAGRVRAAADARRVLRRARARLASCSCPESQSPMPAADCMSVQPGSGAADALIM